MKLIGRAPDIDASDVNRIHCQRYSSNSRSAQEPPMSAPVHPDGKVVAAVTETVAVAEDVLAPALS